ncbi:hypothetical protein DMUE_5564 [Dictyocoela muelleri]|nr:hypothetical protein DMUE_5564 [Dictyocoela muelleri]
MKNFQGIFTKTLLITSMPSKLSLFGIFTVEWGNMQTTTNSFEAYHRHINTKVSKKNMPLFKIIDILKQEEKRIKIKAQNFKSGHYKIKRNENLKKNIVQNYVFFFRI